MLHLQLLTASYKIIIDFHSSSSTSSSSSSSSSLSSFSKSTKDCVAFNCACTGIFHSYIQYVIDFPINFGVTETR